MKSKRDRKERRNKGEKRETRGGKEKIEKWRIDETEEKKGEIYTKKKKIFFKKLKSYNFN